MLLDSSVAWWYTLCAPLPGGAAAAAQLSNRVLLPVPGGHLKLLIGFCDKILRPLHVGLNVFNVGPLFLQQHKNVHEEVPELLQVVLQVQHLLLVRGAERWGTWADMTTVQYVTWFTHVFFEQHNAPLKHLMSISPGLHDSIDRCLKCLILFWKVFFLELWLKHQFFPSPKPLGRFLISYTLESLHA